MSKKYDKDNFWTKDKVARKAEEQTTKYLKSLGFKVLNVEKNPLFQNADIDLIVIDEREHKSFKVEIKGDMHDTPNYFAEIIANRNKNTLGCWLKTKSDFLFYYFIKIGELHIIPTQPAQEWVRNHLNLRQVNVPTKSSEGEFWYDNVGLLVPQKKIQKDVDIYIEIIN